MTKATEAQIKDAKKAMATGGNLPSGVRINFGDPEPYQKHDAGADAPKADDKKDGK